jgi:hypothetical protein
MEINKDLALKKLNIKKALVFVVRKKLFRAIYTGKTNRFTGYSTFHLVRTKGYESFEVDMTTIQGEAAIILVQEDQYYILGENNCKRNTNLDLKPGWFRLRLVGEHAKIRFKLTRHSK